MRLRAAKLLRMLLLRGEPMQRGRQDFTLRGGITTAAFRVQHRWLLRCGGRRRCVRSRRCGLRWLLRGLRRIFGHRWWRHFGLRRHGHRSGGGRRVPKAEAGAAESALEVFEETGVWHGLLITVAHRDALLRLTLRGGSDTLQHRRILVESLCPRAELTIRKDLLVDVQRLCGQWHRQHEQSETKRGKDDRDDRVHRGIRLGLLARTREEQQDQGRVQEDRPHASPYDSHRERPAEKKRQKSGRATTSRRQ
mmetsp:Transcript_108292/g.305297  ORF Transcript_108292/g.305297 Transcript_108292/m.305297 type:complete len:251 (-) Transcript_108292:255-1007(-)